MKKRLLSICLSIIMTLTMIPAVAFADDTGGSSARGWPGNSSGNGGSTVAALPAAVRLESVLGQEPEIKSSVYSVSPDAVGYSIYTVSADVTVYSLNKTVAAKDIVAADSGSSVTFYGTDSTYSSGGAEPIALTTDGITVYVKVEASNPVCEARYALTLSANPSEEPVSFNDENLRLAVCAALKVDSTHNVTVGDMEGLTELDASARGITDLTGLWTAINLETLDLSGNSLTKNLTTTTQYDNVLSGIERLINLKELNLADCDLGVNNANDLQSSPPNSINNSGVVKLSNLEKLDLSHNKMKGYFVTYDALINLKELNLSGNCLKSTMITESMFPALESADFSGNYLHKDESEDYYQKLIETGIEKFTFDNMRNLADIYALETTNAGVTKQYVIDQDTKIVDIGTVLGNNFSIACMAFSSDNTVKVTVNGEKYTAVSFDNSKNSVNIAFSGLESGKEYSVPIEAMHVNGDVQTYTLKFTVKAVTSGSAGIVDANLQYAVCAKLGKDQNTYPVTIEDMEKLTGTFRVYDVANAEGMQYAKGITSLYLYGTYTSLPDLSALVKLTKIYFGGDNLTEVPNLSGNTKITTLSISCGDSLSSLPNLSGLTALTSFSLTGGSNLAVPTGIGDCTKLKTFDISKSSGFIFTGLDAASGLATLKITSCENVMLPESLKNITTLKNLYITSSELTQIPEVVSELSGLAKLFLSGNNLRDFPDFTAVTPGAITSLISLDLSDNDFEDIPDTIAQLKGLVTLKLDSNSISAVTADLSALENLTTLNLYHNDLTGFPETILSLSSLETLDLSYNKIESIDCAMKNKLSRLQTLYLQYNRLGEFPEELKNLTALQTLYMQVNCYTDLPANLDINKDMPALKNLYYGGYIRYGSSASEPDPDSNAADVVKDLKNRGGMVSLYQGGNRFSELRTLEWNFGEITQIHDSLTPAATQDYNLKAPKGTTSLTFTPAAMLEDTKITVNGTLVANKASIEIPVVPGENKMEIICYNPHCPSFYTLGDSTTYNFTIFIGSSVDDNFPVSGKEYSIGMRVWNALLNQYSMADNYIKHTATLTYDDAKEQFAVELTVTKDTWITEMDYMDTSGNYVDAEFVSRDTSANTAVYRMYVKDLGKEFYIKPYVVPMGYAPVCRIIFDVSSIVDTTGPDTLADGTYTIDTDALKETSGDYSMANQFLTENAMLTVEDGIITMKLVMHGTDIIKMACIEGLWYLDENGKYTMLVYRNDDSNSLIYSNAVLDNDKNTLTLTIPLESIQEPLYMKVYVPGYMGEMCPVFRLVCKTDTLTEKDESNPDNAPMKTIADEDGDGTVDFSESDLAGVSDLNANIGFSAGNATLNFPVRYLKNIFAGSSGNPLTLAVSESAASTQNGVIKLLANNDKLAAVYDFSLNLGTELINSFGGRIKITLALTDDKVEIIKNAASKKLCYYNLKTGTLTDMNATFDLTAKTATFYTDHFSTYAIVATTNSGGGGSSGGGGGSSSTLSENKNAEKQSENGSFSDIKGHWAAKAIEYAAEKGILKGVSETQFSPDTAITRGMFVTILGRLAGIKTEDYTGSSFSDVAAAQYYAAYVAWASSQGLVKGVGDGLFDPDRKITREEAASIFAAYSALAGTGGTTKTDNAPVFADQGSISFWAEQGVMKMAETGLFKGDTNNNFNPKKSMTRAEAAALIARSLGFAD